MTFFDVAYEGTPPWDIGRPQVAVVRLAEAGEIVGSVLDVGCGTGENALYLAARGNEVLGLDAAPVAIERATAKARDRGVAAEFVVWDALRLAELGRTFDAVIDVGLFHSFQDEERPVFSRSLHAVLKPGGRYFMLCWSERNQLGYGPRRVTRAEIRETFAEGWTVDSIEDVSFETNVADWSIHAWLARITARSAA
jgi:cyclopropane fatty-acyl-phospholipid synthase-like methyltransferase